MLRTILCTLWLIFAATLLAQPRTIVTTDGEIDDVDSFIRMLLYANEFKLEGLVYSSSMWHYKGDGQGTTMVSEMEMTRRIYGERSELRWPGLSWLTELLDAYEQVYPTLSQHAAGYPTADYLRSIVRVGNIDFEGDMRADTEGSDLIKAKLLDDNTAPLYLQAWGGTNTIARALKSIEEQYKGTAAWPRIQQRVSDKAIIYTIMDQDATLRKYVEPNWPGVTVYYNRGQFGVLAYNWQKQVPEHLRQYFEGDFMGEHIIKGHGPLTALYYSYGDGRQQPGDPEHIHGDPDRLQNAQWGSFEPYDFISEGDSPAFLHLVDVGLGNLEHPEYGGWGGRLAPLPDDPKRYEDGEAVAEYVYYDEKMSTDFPQIRWLEDLQLDFAARADWCVKPFAEANHPPVVKLKGRSERRVRPGQRVKLRAKYTDPDGDRLTVGWWQYSAAGTYGERELADLPLERNEYFVPDDLRPGETIHLICTVRDDGTPALTRYQRLVLIGK